MVGGLELGLIDAAGQHQPPGVQRVVLQGIGHAGVLKFVALGGLRGKGVHKRGGSGGGEPVCRRRLDKKEVQIIVGGQHVGDDVAAQFNVDIAQLVGGVAVYRGEQRQAVGSVRG